MATSRQEAVQRALAAKVAERRASSQPVSNWQAGATGPQQYATQSPGAGWVWDQASAGWMNPNGAPGQSYVAMRSTPQQLQAWQAEYQNTGAGGAGTYNPRQLAVQAALQNMAPAQRQAAVQGALGRQGGGLLSTGKPAQTTQNPLLNTPYRTSGGGPGPVPGRTTMTAQSGGGEQNRQQQVQAALANMPPQVRQMMIQRALMQQGGVPGIGNSLPGQFQPPSMGSFGGGYSAQPGLPSGWGGAQATPFTQGNYIPPMQMVNPSTGQAQGGPMFGQQSPFGAPQPFWFGQGGG